MLKNIENFDGWLEFNSYEDITIGKGEITLHVTSLKLMMKYMPIVQELDIMINDINSFNEVVMYEMSYCKHAIYNIKYEEEMMVLNALMEKFYEKLDNYKLEMVSYSLNTFDEKYIENIILKLK